MERSEILTEDWLLECWKEKDNRNFDALNADFIRTYRAKPLHNLNLFFFGAADDIEQRHLRTLVLANGKNCILFYCLLKKMHDVSVDTISLGNLQYVRVKLTAKYLGTLSGSYIPSE